MNSDKEIYILPKSGQSGARKVVSRLKDSYGVDLLYPQSSKTLRSTVLKSRHTPKKVYDALLPNVPVVMAPGAGVNYRYYSKTRRYTMFLGEHNTFSDVLHDIAHWMLAGKVTRRRAEYGVGGSPDDTSIVAHWDREDALPYPDTSKGWPEAHKISLTVEMYASALGIAFEYSLGLDYLNTVSYHNWDHYDELAAHWVDLKEYCGGLLI